GNNIFTNDVNFIDGDFDTVNVSMNAADQQLFENRKFGIPEIARFLGIPPVLLFDYSNSSYKSYEDSNIEFLCRSLAPVINEIETEFNAKLIDEYDFGKYQFEFSARKLMKMN
ncbi:phage portal protein, partial [Vibrio parahaemolyticus]|uniref:phage portal protein n=1 Tax=Vibrio parahaemolyticus TaxID=670 RepID=UPI002112FCFD